MPKGIKVKNGTVVSKSIYSTEIAIISSIIHDGVQNKEELTRKYAAVTNRPYELAAKCIAQLEEREEVGYYETIQPEKANNDLVYYFIPWKGTKPAFPPSKFYKGKNYFKAFFRGGPKNNNGLIPENE